MDLLHGDGEDGAQTTELPQFYQPEPFMVPDPTSAGSHSGHGDDNYQDSSDRRQSTQTSTTGELLRSGTPDPNMLGVGAASTSGSNNTRKSPLGPTQLRPVNIIQHDDAGPEEQEGETIELPPAYTNIKKPTGSTANLTNTNTDNATATTHNEATNLST